MNHLQSIFRFFLNPTSAVGNIMDHGSWIVAALACVALSIALFFSLGMPVLKHMSVGNIIAFPYEVSGTPDNPLFSEDMIESEEAYQAYVASMQETAAPDFIVRTLLPKAAIMPILILALFYLPAALMLGGLYGRLGNLGVIFQREYATFAVCGLTAFVSASIPFAALGILFSGVKDYKATYSVLWLAFFVLFAGFMTAVGRTVLGLGWGTALAASLSAFGFWIIGFFIISLVGPWILSPFLIILGVYYFGGFVSGEVSGLGLAMRQKRDLKRFLQNATVNPNDADAHVQLGLIYSQRRQAAKALEHFEKAYSIDKEEIDANYQLGIIARKRGDLQKAIEHFSVVVEQDEKFALSEVWREIGATYLDANMLDEALEPLEKFVSRRGFDPEGLYYLGMVLKKRGETERAKEMFERATEAVKTAAYYRRAELQQWGKLAKQEL
ncbi:MAG: tetratricopeptide repeat protein [Pyrinomonadaceae bacterium]